MTSLILGRMRSVADLAESLRSGMRVLLYGPVGSGKTAVLEEVARALRREGRPVGISASTRGIPDASMAMAAAYPALRASARGQGHFRRVLRDALLDQKPGALLLDHVVAPTSALKGFLRSLDGTGLGVAMAVDVENSRDHLAIRARHLAYIEQELPPLPGQAMSQILDDRLASAPLPHAIEDQDRRLLLAIAHGRPGWLEMMSRRLSSSSYWSQEGRLKLELLRVDVSAEVGGRYMHAAAE